MKSTIAITLDTDIVERIQKEKELSGQSVSYIMQKAIEAYFKNLDKRMERK